MKRFITTIIVFFVFVLFYEIIDTKTGNFGAEKINTDFSIYLTPEEEKWIEDHPKLKIGVFKDFYPYGYLEKDGKYAGVSSTYLEIIKEKTGMTFEYVWFSGTDEALQAFNTYEVNFFAVSKLGNSEFKVNAIYSTPYYTTVAAIFTNRHNKLYVNSIKDINGKKIAIDKDGYKYSRSIREQKGFEPVMYNDTVTAIHDVNEDRIYGFIGDLLLIKGVVAKYNYTNVHFATTFASKNVDLGFVTHKDNQIFIDIVNKVIEKIDTKSYQVIVDEWIYSTNPDLEAFRKKYVKYAIIITSIFVLSFLVSLISIFSLRRHNKYINLLKNDYQSLLNKAPIAFFTQKDNFITYVNEEFVKLLGGEKENYLNQDYHQFIDEKNLKLAFQQISGAAFHDIKLTRIDNHKTIYVNLKRLNIKFGGENMVLIMVLDVTERKNVEAEKRKFVKKAALGQKMEMIGMLSGRVAHDFNNILAGINGSAEFLDIELPKDSTLKKYTNIIINACKSAAYLTKELLVFAKNKDSLFCVMNVNDVANRCVELLKNSIINYKSINIETNFRANPPYIFGSEDLFQNLVINLGFNARDALKEGGKILIQTKNVVLTKEDIRGTMFKTKPGKYIEFSVEDDGIGMSSEIQKNIFEPFFTTKAKDKGTGLGMIAVYNIVKDHNATMKLTSEVEKGTKFSIYFPISKEKVEKEKAEETKQAIPSKIEAKILIVDDEPILLSLLKDILQHLGSEVLTASNYDEAVKKYKENANIDLVLLDVIMPDKSGLDVYESLKKMNKDLRAIFVTGYSKDKKIGDLVSSTPYLDLIGKPYNISDITNKILNLLAKK